MSDLSDWTAFGKMQADYVTALATYGKEQANAVKTLADAEKTEAEAAILREKFDAINLVLDSLQKFLRREGKKWRKLDEDNAKIAKDALNVGTLNSGSSRKTADAIKSNWTNLWASFERIKRMALADPQAGKAVRGLTLSENSYDASNFVSIRAWDKKCDDLPRSYKFVIAMVDWMHDQMYIPNSNGDAGQDFEKLIAEINNVAVAYKNELQERMDKMDDKIFFNWVLPTVGGFINGTDGGGGQPKGRGG